MNRAARAHYDATIADYRQATLTAFQEVEDNLAALRLLADENQTQTAAVQAAAVSRTQAERRYTAGYANYYDVITAQTSSFPPGLNR